MPDGKKTKTQLITELQALRRRISQLESGKKPGEIPDAIPAPEIAENRNRVEAELRAARERAQHYLDIAQVIFIALDTNQNITLINPKGCQILGYSKDELLGKNWFDHFLPNKLLGEVKHVFDQIISGDLEPVEYYENPVLTRDGSEKIIVWHNSILRDDAGKITGLFSSGEDITERKLAEEALRESKERWKSLAENAAGFVTIVDRNHVVEYINHPVSGIEHEDVIGHSVYDFIQPEYHDVARKSIESVFATGLPCSYESVAAGPEGTLAFYDSRLGPIIVEGRTIAVSIFGTDITERRRAETELTAKQQFIETIVNLSPDILYIYDLIDRKNIYSNDGILKILGYSVEDIQAMGDQIIPTLMHPDDFQVYLQQTFPKYGLAKNDEFIEHQFRMKSKDGRWCWLQSVETIFLREPNGSPRQIFGVLHDVTESKLAEDRLKASEQKFRMITEGSADAIFITDMEGKYIYVNKASSDLLGYSREELLGMSISDLSREDMIDESLKSFMEVLEMGGAYSEIELRRKDGVFIPVDLNAVILTDELVYGSCRNISERKHAEDRIQNSLREKEVMLKEIHHRVKNNMQIISSLINLQTEGISDQSTLDKLQACRRRIKAMALIHEGLYEASDLSHIDFSLYIRKMTTHIFSAYSLLSNRVELKVDVKNIFLDINTAIPCGLIIDELVSNTLKHGFPERRAGHISVKMAVDGKGAHNLSIVDDGIGISEDIDWKNPSSLGLQLVSDLVRQINGTITVKRKNGTSIHIKF